MSSNLRQAIRIGDVEIPGTVVFHILLCCRGGWKPQVPSVFTEGKLPSLPKGHTKDTLRRMAKGQMLPAVCGHCQRITGYLEGGRLQHDCAGCTDTRNYNDSESWSIVGALSYTLGEWASDCVVVAVLGAFLELRESNNGNL